MPIYFYSTRADYGAFSNFSRHGFNLDGTYWRTVEHYFQAMKTDDPEWRNWIAIAPDPKEAKKRAWARKPRTNWDVLRDDVMRRAVLAKFEHHTDLQELLLSTGKEEIVEAAPHDYYWGAGKDGSGQNKLGLILIEVREILRQRQETQDATTSRT